jgi:hypothetical protein
VVRKSEEETCSSKASTSTTSYSFAVAFFGVIDAAIVRVSAAASVG